MQSEFQSGSIFTPIIRTRLVMKCKFQNKKAYCLLTILSLAFLVSACGGDGGDKDDSKPDQFSFDDETDVGLGEYVVSDYITIEGINTEATISITGGEYSIDGGEFTDEEGEVTEGQNVYVRVLSSELLSTETEATLTVDEVEDTFTVKTIDIALNARDGFKSIVFSWPTVTGAANYKLLEKETANAEFVQKGRLFSSSAIGYTMDLGIHLHDWLNSEYKLEACTSASCSTTDEISLYNHMTRAIGYIKAPNTEANDLFGSVAISADGNTIAVGAPGEDSGLPGVNRDYGDNSLSGSGAVYIYVKDDDNWRLQSYIKSPAPGEGDAFGSSVSLSSDGNILAVGVPYDDSGDFVIDGNSLDNSAQDSGAVYVYQRFGDTWFVQNYLKASTGAAGDTFGTQVDVSDFGATLAVSAPLADSSVANTGAVYVYSIAGDTWQEADILSPPVEKAGEQFGGSVSITADGGRIAVGARYFDASLDGSAITGKVYLFEKNETDWLLSRELTASNARHGMEFGYDVALALDGDSLVVGAPGESSNAFQVNGDQSDTSLPAAGAAYVFVNDGNNWNQTAYLKAENSDSSDRFGTAVAIDADGDTVIVSAIGESSSATAIHGNVLDNGATDAGAAYVFIHADNAWQALNYVKAPNTNAGDAFGAFLDLDASGNALVVGAPFEDSDAKGLSGSRSNNTASDAGAVYFY